MLQLPYMQFLYKIANAAVVDIIVHEIVKLVNTVDKTQQVKLDKYPLIPVLMNEDMPFSQTLG